jgi:FSR family fosmidomycin resistance protein-like MFS transporter
VIRRAGLLTVLLLGVDFLDELTSGIPFVGSPDVQRSFGLTYGMAAGWTLAVLQLLSLLLEPPLFVLADRYPKKRFVCGGLLVLGLTCVVAGLAPSYWVFLLALGILGPASGCGVSLSQAVLMDANPDTRERMMARWTFMGCAGDLATPALLSALGLFALGWRHGFVLMGFVVVLYAGLLSRQRFPESRPEGRGVASVPLRTAVASAIRNRRLLLWSAGVWLCCMLDEIVVAFGALYLRDHVGAGLHERSLILMLWMGGQLVGLVAVDRLLARVEPLRLLMTFAACGAVAYLGWVLAPSIWLSGVSMAIAGFFCSAFYPIAMAQAYRALPGYSGTVNAVAHLFLPLTVALPVLLGLVADTLGLTTVLLILACEPVGLFWIATRERARGGPEL